jgi:Domain of unknown function (DUF4397)
MPLPIGTRLAPIRLRFFTQGFTMIQVSRVLRYLVFAAMSASVLAACGGSDDDDFDDRANVADPKVRFVHAVPGGPNVTLRRNGSDESSATDMSYKSASQYYDVGTDNYTFTLITRPGDVELSSTALGTERANKYTVVALPDDSGVELLSIRDPYNKGLTSKDARVRVLNAAINAQTFDVYLTPAGADLTSLQPNLASIGYKQAAPASGADSVEVPAATYQLRLTAAGSKTPFFSASVTAPENGDWLLIALPNELGTNAVRLLLVRSDDSADATDEIVSE